MQTRETLGSRLCVGKTDDGQRFSLRCSRVSLSYHVPYHKPPNIRSNYTFDKTLMLITHFSGAPTELTQ